MEILPFQLTLLLKIHYSFQKAGPSVHGCDRCSGIYREMQQFSHLRLIHTSSIHVHSWSSCKNVESKMQGLTFSWSQSSTKKLWIFQMPTKDRKSCFQCTIVVKQPCDRSYPGCQRFSKRRAMKRQNPRQLIDFTTPIDLN